MTVPRTQMTLAAAIAGMLLCLPSQVRAQTRNITVPIAGSQEWLPPHTAGDQEFDGHGPDVYAVVKFSVRYGALYRQIFMRARETKRDFTMCHGWSPAQLAYLPPNGWKVRSINGRSTFIVYSARMRGHAPVVLPTSVGTVAVWGDRRGQDAGVYTRIRINYRTQCPIVLERSAPRNEVVSVRLPDSLTVVPRRKGRGDREFNGNGPRIEVSSRCSHNGRQVLLELRMWAQETKRDWTAGAGTTSIVIYTAPPGTRITGLGGIAQPHFQRRYTDRDHSAETFASSVGRFSVFGDRRGKDIGEYTRMVARYVGNIPVRIAPTS